MTDRTELRAADAAGDSDREGHPVVRLAVGTGSLPDTPQEQGMPEETRA